MKRVTNLGGHSVTTEQAVQLAKEIWRVDFITDEDHIRIGQFVKAINASSDSNKLRRALVDVAATLAWSAHGDCRAFTAGPVLTSSEAVKLAEKVLIETENPININSEEN